MTGFIIITSIILVISLLRFGLSFEYGIDGFTAAFKVGPLTFSVYPQRERSPRRKRIKTEKKSKRAKKEKKESVRALPGSLSDFYALLPDAKRFLGRFRRKLLIKTLIIHYVAGSPLAADTAFAFGASNIVFHTIVPIFERFFRIKNKDLRASADFNAQKPMIYVEAAISIALWEIIYVTLAIIPLLVKITKMSNSQTPQSQSE
ncbi:MAG: hypothetical protein FWG88_00870 [Oscillospiraceae bacterium]|nr:hypothetical protein [Oscillospiraceae bacterium]